MRRATRPHTRSYLGTIRLKGGCAVPNHLGTLRLKARAEPLELPADLRTSPGRPAEPQLPARPIGGALGSRLRALLASLRR